MNNSQRKAYAISYSHVAYILTTMRNTFSKLTLGEWESGAL